MSDSQEYENSDATVVAENFLAAHSSRFRIIRCLGSGGMGDVHLAEDSKLRRLVAIKSIRSDLCQDEEIRKRIERECLLHAKIGAHPHIVTLYDRLEDAGRINLVMEYVDGETLQQLLERTNRQGQCLSWKDALTIACQCLDALARIHSHGIVHRDIKPSNILITRDDSGQYCAKLMDFGIARPQTEDEQSLMLTKEGVGGPGTPLYMAPEQIDPKTFGPVSVATDIYAMGVMLYQIVSGKPPFTGSLTEIFYGHLNCSPPPIDLHGDSNIPKAIVDVIHKALSKKPSQRFPTARAFKEELQRLLMQGDAAFGMPGSSATAPIDHDKTLSADMWEQAELARGATLLDSTKAAKKLTPTSRIKTVGILGVVVLAIAIIAGITYYYVYAKKTTPAQPEISTTSPETSPSQQEVTAEKAQETQVISQETTAATSTTSTQPQASEPTQLTDTSTTASLPSEPIPSADTSGTYPSLAADTSKSQEDSSSSIMDMFKELRSQTASTEVTPSEPQPPSSTGSAGTSTEPQKPKPNPPASKGTSGGESKPTESKPTDSKPGGQGWDVIKVVDKKVE